MLSPKELYYQYTTNPCENGGINFIGDPIPGDVGRGTPYDLQRLTNFLKQLKYPCYNQAPFANVAPSTSGILNTGAGRLALPFKFLQRLDVEAFSEIQPDIKSGTSHAVRNACDITRVCYIEASGIRDSWEHRGATEYIEYFGQNYITDCLMTLGPDLVFPDQAIKRGTGCKDLSCLPRFDPKKEGSALGAKFSCQNNLVDAKITIECSPCKLCEKTPEQIDPNAKDCCSSGSCEEKMNFCCGDVTGERYGGAWDYSPDWRSDATLTSDMTTISQTDFPLRHIGILKRKSYGGYVNLLNNSGSNFYSCPGDILLRRFQQLNQYNYTTQTYVKNVSENAIDRVRTISIIQGSSSEIMGSIKDLLYNGYGVVIMTNVGFPNKRDSTGVSYPDRIWYHSYAIIGYDDRRTDYVDCVYLLANSWGKWNDGGHPSWGPIPDGSFLVTETHLKSMLNLYRTDQIGCRKKTGINYNPQDPKTAGCVTDSSCSPWTCTTKQQAMGMAFALSMNEGFPKQELDYAQFYKVREQTGVYDEKLFFRG